MILAAAQYPVLYPNGNPRPQTDQRFPIDDPQQPPNAEISLPSIERKLGATPMNWPSWREKFPPRLCRPTKVCYPKT